MTTRNDRIEIISWLALVIALLAMFVAAVSFNQIATVTNLDMQTMVADQLEINRQQTALSNAKTQLETLRTNVSTGNSGVNPEPEIDRVRADLRESFANFNEKTKSEWLKLDEELMEIQANLRNGAVTVVAAIDQMIDKVQTNIDKTIKKNSHKEDTL